MACSGAVPAAGAVDVENPPEAPGESADHLLDRILRNALGTDPVQDKGGVKKEQGNIKSEPGALVKSEKVKAEPLDLPALPGTDGDAKGGAVAKRSRSRGKKKRSRSRGKKKRSRSRKRRKRSSSSSSSESKSPVAAALEGLPQARVVAVRGNWAQYLSPAGETFYKNVLNNEVQWQKPGNFDCQPSRRAGEMTPGPNEAACYIFHMPPEWTESDLMQLFAPFGQVTSAHIQRDANGFSRSCGFVTYASPDGANQACQMMNGFGVDGKFLKVSLTQFTLGGTMQPGAPAPAPAAGNMGGLQTGGLGGSISGMLGR
mmetsp:Transcript_13061/g.24027  ORF Transcript_13061/g.24027 Transcript_13061/m.24027 type:complete len:315 (+) Transcript_13061:110-1054(+)